MMTSGHEVAKAFYGVLDGAKPSVVVVVVVVAVAAAAAVAVASAHLLLLQRRQPLPALLRMPRAPPSFAGVGPPSRSLSRTLSLSPSRSLSLSPSLPLSLPPSLPPSLSLALSLSQGRCRARYPEGHRPAPWCKDAAARISRRTSRGAAAANAARLTSGARRLGARISRGAAVANAALPGASPGRACSTSPHAPARGLRCGKAGAWRGRGGYAAGTRRGRGATAPGIRRFGADAIV